MLITLIFLSISCGVFAQDSLKTFNYTRLNTTVTGMEVLGSWGIANIATGIVGTSNSAGGSNKYFYKMTTIWGAANLGVAILGYLQNTNTKLYESKTLKEQQKIERTFLINGGLDVAYLGVGLYLKNRGDNQNSDKLKGYGSAILVQSAFLLLFDGTMYGTHRHTGNKLRKFLEKNPISFNGRTVGINFNM